VNWDTRKYPEREAPSAKYCSQLGIAQKIV